MAMRDEVIQDLDKLFRTYKKSEWFQEIIEELAKRDALSYNAMDLALLTEAIRKTLEEQCADGVKEALYYILREEWLSSVTRNIAEYYKEFLTRRERHENGQEDDSKDD